MDYGGKIRFVRTKVRDMTLKELADKSGLSISYLSDAELGRSNMSIASLQKVAEALDVSPAYLLDNKIMSLRKIIEINDVELPEDVVEFFATQEGLPYAMLAKDLHNESIDPTFLRELLESIKKMKSK